MADLNPDETVYAAQMSFQLMRETFLDMAVALAERDPAALEPFMLQIERARIDSLRRYLDIAGHKNGAKRIAATVATSIGDVTKEARNRARVGRQ